MAEGVRPRTRPRRTVSAVIFTRDGMLLAGRRSERKRHGVGQWQFIQGGMEAGEEILAATLREINEEVGLHAADLVLVHLMQTPIVRGDPAAPKQLLYFSLFYWPSGDLARCKLDFEVEPEFTEVTLFRWSDFLGAVVDFKREMYLSVKDTFEVMINNYVARLQQATA